MMASGIYIIKCSKNGKFYIGQAQNLKIRWSQHKSSLKRNNHKNKHLQNMWNKYGESSFKFQILEYWPIEKLTEREQHYMDIYRPTGMCVNIAQYADASSRGRVISEESRRKMSEASKSRTHSAETRRKMSEIQKNRSDETRQKISEAHKGKIHSAETRRKIGEKSKGRIHSDETRHKISEALKGRMISEETRRKLSESAKRRRERERAAKEQESAQ